MKHLTKVLFLILVGMLVVPAYAGISEQEFDEVLDLAARLYRDDFDANNQRLQITRFWDSDTRSAMAWKHEDKNGEISVLDMRGGIARHPEITKDAFALIVCHEIGHHIGGPPYNWKFSVEGQSDYFGASECMRRMLPHLDQGAVDTEALSYRLINHICSRGLPEEERRDMCIRIALAGEALSRFFAAEKEVAYPNFELKDDHVAVGVLSGAASPQCRLDTYLAAALCDPSRNQSAPAGERWLCKTGTMGGRPRCWFGER